MCHFRAQNDPFDLNKNFLVQTIIITFNYLLALFIVQNLKKFLQQIQSYEDVPFLGPNWSICSPPKFFWYKPLLLLSSTYWSFLLRKILKKSYRGSRVLRMHHFWAQIGPFAQNNFFW